jgi:hypothetical protein
MAKSRASLRSGNRRGSHVGVGLALVCAIVGCKGEDARRGPPPPPPTSTARAGACAEGGGKLDDAASAPFFPRVTGGFCLDPNGGAKTFGDGAALPIDKICDVFDGECEIYRAYTIRRLVELRYVDGKGTPATIDVHLSKFASPEGAYGMFTKRVVGDGDPIDTASKPTPATGRAALGVGNAYVWRGEYLVELTYNDETLAEDALKATSEKLLPPLVVAVSERLPGAATPPAVALLPRGCLPLGERYVTKDLLGIEGVGGGVFGYYRDGDKRFRFAAMPRADEEQAKDVIATMLKLGGATKEKYIGDGAVRVMRKDGDGPAVEWIFARVGKNVVGVGDEPRAVKSGATAEELAKVSLSKDEKIAKLKAALKPDADVAPAPSK